MATGRRLEHRTRGPRRVCREGRISLQIRRDRIYAPYALEDPELFATYVELTADARAVVMAHVDTLVGQLARIIADGVAQSAFETTDPLSAGRAVFDATARFPNPAHAPAWGDPGIDAANEGVRTLVLRGLERKRARGRR